MRIFIDLETIPDQTPGALDAIRQTIKPPGNITKPESIAKWIMRDADAEAEKQWRKTALDGTKGEIICIGFAFNENEPVQSFQKKLIHSEESLLRAFWEIVNTKVKYQGENPFNIEWVGHRLIDFDARFLFKRSIINRVKPTVRLDPSQRHGGKHLFDTAIEWAGHKDYVSLDTLCKALGIESPKDNGMDGSKVYDALLAGKHDEIAEYCRADVYAMRECWKRITFYE